MSSRRLLIWFAAFALLALGVWPAGTARAESDITGTWNFTFSGEPRGSAPFECHDVEISQAGEDVVLASDVCFPSGEAAGTLIKATGEVHVYPSCVDGLCSFLMWGTVAPDGETISGTYGVVRHTVGTFEAVRKPPTVGGFAIELQTRSPRAQGRASLGVVAAVAATVLALGGAGWYARWRGRR